MLSVIKKTTKVNFKLVFLPFYRPYITTIVNCGMNCGTHLQWMLAVQACGVSVLQVGSSLLSNG